MRVWFDFIKDSSFSIFNTINWSILTFLVIVGACNAIIGGVIFLYLFAAVTHTASAVKTLIGIT